MTETLPRLLTPSEAAEALRCSPRTLADWRLGEGGPPFHRVGARIVYDANDITRWLDRRRVPVKGGGDETSNQG